jgi:hypothetical protein
MGLTPSFAAVEAGPMGNTPRWRFELGGGVDDVSNIKPFTPGVGGLGRRLVAESHRARH